MQKEITAKLMKRLIFIPAILAMFVSAYVQDVHYNYELGANFAKYKTYQWVNLPDATFSDQLVDQAIMRAVDEQLERKVSKESKRTEIFRSATKPWLKTE